MIPIEDFNIWFIFFFIWGFPLGFYRSSFRKKVYQTDSWMINIKPLFVKELIGLFGNLFPDDKNYIKVRNFYRFYLLVYLILFIFYMFFGKN